MTETFSATISGRQGRKLTAKIRAKNLRNLELEIDGLRNLIDNFHATVCSDSGHPLSNRVQRALEHLFLHGNLARKAKEEDNRIKVNDIVLILPYKDSEINSRGRVTQIMGDGSFHVSNMNMPFSGTISDFFTERELEKQ